MKNIFIFTFFAIIGWTTIITGQLAIFSGYGQSNFDMDGVDQAGYIPLGAALYFGEDVFYFGAEINYSAYAFTFESKSEGVESKLTQLLIGGVAKVRFDPGPHSRVVPFLRLGGGYYMGDWTIENTETNDKSTQKFKGAFGFNFGGGLDFKMHMGIFYLEFVYHKVDRKPDVSGAKSFRADNFAGHIGFIFDL